eukprot:1153237-Pelagomonas_calceolata.AAC.2
MACFSTSTAFACSTGLWGMPRGGSGGTTGMWWSEGPFMSCCAKQAQKTDYSIADRAQPQADRPDKLAGGHPH